jgi:hypothetical protein
MIRRVLALLGVTATTPPAVNAADDLDVPPGLFDPPTPTADNYADQMWRAALRRLDQQYQEGYAAGLADRTDASHRCRVTGTRPRRRAGVR